MDKTLNKKVVVISVIAVVALVIGISLAIFIVRRTGNEHAFTSANLTLNFGDGSAIIRNTGIEPIYEDEVKSLATTKEFTIQNTSNKTLYVTLSLEEITAQSELKSELFHWDLYETTSGSETLVDSGNFNVGSETTLDMINDITFNANQTKNYKLYVWLEETLEDQNALQGLSFSSRIVAKGYLKPLQYRDNSGANAPKLADGMIPVVYDETSGNWEVADKFEEWYNYDKQWWANAVTIRDCQKQGDINQDGVIDQTDMNIISQHEVGLECGNFDYCDEEVMLERGDITGDGVADSEDVLWIGRAIEGLETPYPLCNPKEPMNRADYENAEAGTPISMEDINSMWVWIPRYKYRIPSSIGVGTSTPPQIDVVFESGTNTTGSTLSSCSITSTSCYYTHPAFRDGSSVYKTTAYDQGGWDEELERN